MYILVNHLSFKLNALLDCLADQQCKKPGNLSWLPGLFFLQPGCFIETRGFPSFSWI